MARRRPSQSAWSEMTKPRSSERRRRVPRMRIQPEAKAVERGPKRRIHGALDARGGARIRAWEKPVFGGRDQTGEVGGSATPCARYRALTRSTAPCV